MIYLSASGIKDFLACPYRYYFRRQKVEVVLPEPIIIGNIVHKAIEVYDNVDDAIEYAENAWHSYVKDANKKSFISVNSESTKDYKLMIRNYYNKIVPQYKIDSTAIKELSFKIDVLKDSEYDDVKLVGKIDLMHDDIIFDWKTSGKYINNKEFILRDLQFYIYYIAYKELYGQSPKSIKYGHLITGNTYDIIITDDLIENTFNIIEYTVNSIRYFGYTPPVKVVGYNCGNCLYKDICIK